MIGRATTVIVVVFLLLGVLMPFIGSQEGIAQGSDGLDVVLSTRGTFLLAEPFEGDNPVGGTNVESPLILDLEANGLPGDTPIEIDYVGEICIDAYWSDQPPVWISAKKDSIDLLGVFSTDSRLEPITELNRIPGAIDYGMDHISDQTYFDGLTTDIPEDFKVIPYGEIVVPHDAKYLFFCIDEGGFYPDNLGTIWIRIEKVNDTDGDGLLDSWEKDGIDYDHDGNIDLDLPDLGADWEHKDIFVEADYMSGKLPDFEAIEDVQAAFSNAHVPNPDNNKGINLHVLIDESVPWSEFIDFNGLYALKNTYFGTENERSNINAIQAKKMVYRYCLFADKLSLGGVSPKCPGVAEGILCDDFILAFGAFDDNNREDQAAVFMHELGHTLNLRHGGDTDMNYKPNYLSIMNYAFQFNNYVPTRPLDYSYGKHYILNETSIYESQGIGELVHTVWLGPDGKFHTNGLGGYAIDWNVNHTLDAHLYKMNLNNWTDHPSPPGETLRDFNDWENLVYKFRGTPLSAASATPDDYHIELTTDQIEQMRQEAANMTVVDSPTIEETDAGGSGLPMEVVLGIVAVAAIVVVVAALFFMRKKKK